MSNLIHINKPGDYKDVLIAGKDRNLDIGLTIECWGDDVVNIRNIEITNTFVPILKVGDGQVNIENASLYLFGGDGMNIRGSNLFVDNLNIEGNTPTRPYMRLEVPVGSTVEKVLFDNDVKVYDPSAVKTYVDKNTGKVYIEYYHQDAIQMYATAKGKYVSTEQDLLENIVVNNLNITMSGENNQGIALTEKCGYNSIHLGTNKLNIAVDYYYSLIATNLNNFTIGNQNHSNVNKPVRLEQPKGKESKYWFFDGVVAVPGKHVIDKEVVNVKHIIPKKYA